MKLCVHVQLYLNILRVHGLWPDRLLCKWDFPGKYTGVGCHFFLQGNLPDSEIEPAFLHLPPMQTESLPLRHPLVMKEIAHLPAPPIT